jgi:hypothetical protein
MCDEKVSVSRSSSSSSWEMRLQLLVSSLLYLLHSSSAASFGKGTVVVGGETVLSILISGNTIGNTIRKRIRSQPIRIVKLLVN